MHHDSEKSREIVRAVNSDEGRALKMGIGSILVIGGLIRVVRGWAWGKRKILAGGLLLAEGVGDFSLTNAIFGYPIDGESARKKVH